MLTIEVDDHSVGLLASIAGIGELTARTLLAEIETVYRLPYLVKLISYASLAPQVKQSASMGRPRELTKHSSVWLWTILIESAQVAVGQLNQFQRVFRGVAFRRGRNVGVVAAARRLVKWETVRKPSKAGMLPGLPATWVCSALLSWNDEAEQRAQAAFGRRSAVPGKTKQIVASDSWSGHWVGSRWGWKS